MNKQQFKRLTLVVALPLLTFGAWLALEEVLIPAHHMTRCLENETFSCRMVNVTKDELYAETWYRPNVAVNGTGVLPDGINHEVRAVGHREIRFEDGERVEGPVIGGDKVIQVERVTPRIVSMGRRDPCQIFQHGDVTKRWTMHCWPDMPLTFEFVDSATAEKFERLADTIRVNKETGKATQLRAYAVVTVIPLAAYFAFSLVVFVAMRLFRFIRGPVAAA